jgi:hypothetical protein
VLSTGDIQLPNQYGTAQVFGIEGALSADYQISRSVFARAAFHYETIGHTFQGNGTLSNARDGDPSTPDVTGARDSYLGGSATVGAAF